MGLSIYFNTSFVLVLLSIETACQKFHQKPRCALCNHSRKRQSSDLGTRSTALKLVKSNNRIQDTSSAVQFSAPIVFADEYWLFRWQNFSAKFFGWARSQSLLAWTKGLVSVFDYHFSHSSWFLILIFLASQIDCGEPCPAGELGNIHRGPLFPSFPLFARPIAFWHIISPNWYIVLRTTENKAKE